MSRTERPKARAQPGGDLRNRLQYRPSVMLAERVIRYVHGQAATLGHVEKTLDLRLDIQLILAAVGDEHGNLTGTNLVAFQDLDGIFPAQRIDGVRSPAIDR